MLFRSIVHTYQAELFPTSIRAGAVGFVYSWSRLSSIFVGFFIAFFLREFGVPGVFIFISGAMAIVVVAVALFGPRTTGRGLDEIANEALTQRPETRDLSKSVERVGG